MANTKAPRFYQQLSADHPEVFDTLEQLGVTLRRTGPLDERVAHLVKLAAAAAVRSEGAVHSHVRRALAAGVSREEIEHALLLLIPTIGMPQVVAALSWSRDVKSASRTRRKRG
jgi:AhpD family alkylhydroperoxidase